MKVKKFYTVKEWNKFKSNDYFDMQDMLCQKYDVILTDYQTKREKIFSVLKKINLKNLDKGITGFSKLVQSFGGSMDQLTREINSQKHKDKDNLDLVWGKSENSVPIWSTSEKNNDSQAQHKANLEKIWGKRT
ncbi:hypothetical protein OAK22_01755 [Nitrosopumilus sp.]|nr:hypothetical protein [Nitrosopumilus sp.]